MDIPAENRSLPTRVEYRRLITAVVCFLIILGGGYFLLNLGILKWPFQQSSELKSSLALILFYSPLVVLSTLSLLWLKSKSYGNAIKGGFKWKRFSYTFIVAIAVSAGYSEYLLNIRTFGLFHYGNWLPVIVLSLLNSFSEEIFFRLVLYELSLKALNSRLAANILQSLLYSIVHFGIGGLEFGLSALVYGLLLGVIKERNQSVIPCLICHFVIDLGCIGAPMLSRMCNMESFNF